MKPNIVVDTGPLIALAKLDQLSLLEQLFSSIHVPQTVLLEASYDHKRADACKIAEFANHSSVFVVELLAFNNK